MRTILWLLLLTTSTGAACPYLTNRTLYSATIPASYHSFLSSSSSSRPQRSRRRRGLFASSDKGGGGGAPLTTLEQVRQDVENLLTGRLRAQFVRLAFHDCVGGCDGCVDLSNPENFGLQEPVDVLETIVSKYAAQNLTRADIWVLAGLTAAEVAQEGRAIAFDMTFTGRPSCDDPQGGPERIFPSPHLTAQGVLDYFETTFDFSLQETVAIMGAHTLGIAQIANSGFDGIGGWVPNEERLDNQFYRELLQNDVADPEWQQEEQNNEGLVFTNQFLWRKNGRRLFMLNTDMALAINTAGFITDVGQVTCNPCPPSTMLETTRLYHDNDAQWRTDFRDAFIKMTNTGCNADTCTLVA